MAAVNYERKPYQKDALARLKAYLQRVGTVEAGEYDAVTPAALAFSAITGGGYVEAPDVAKGTPYVCIRIPTGGGKTIVAAKSVGVAAREYLQADNPMVLWLVPSTAILDQTLAALRNLNHPYRAALEEDFGHNISVLTVAEALALSRPDATGGACIIVATMQSFKIDPEKETEARRVYRDNGALMEHFSGLSADQKAPLEFVEGTARPVASLANVLRLHRPMVIVDEAHNARTPLSYDTLARLHPSMILELTATPQLAHDPEKGEYPSNILFHVSAAELKAAEMIKMPIRLETQKDWRIAVGKALEARDALEKLAAAEERESGEYIRPIILFQVQSRSKADPHRIDSDALIAHLTEDKNLSREEIAAHGQGHNDLDAIDDIEASDIRYVITQSKLKEGWDCPFAYVLCSVAELGAATAVEQILGRVLRLPNVKRKAREELNTAYAFVASESFGMTAKALTDGLVEGAGFDPIEAERMVRNHHGYGFGEDPADYVHDAEPLPEDESTKPEAVEQALGRLPETIRAKVSYDGATRKLAVRGRVSLTERNLMLLSLNNVKGADRQIDRLYRKSNRLLDHGGDAEGETETAKPPFIMPQLGFWRGGKNGTLEVFGPEHFLDFPWHLSDCDVSGFIETFRIVDRGHGGTIDIGEDRKLTVSTAGQVQWQLAGMQRAPNWSLPGLVNWIDRGIETRDVMKVDSRLFIQKALEGVMSARGYTLEELVRYQYPLRRALANEIGNLRNTRERDKYGELFANEADKFETSADIGLVFDEVGYAWNWRYRGRRQFKKHYFRDIGDLKSEGEEFGCACYLDDHPKVAYWLRNVERKEKSFWLQLPSGRTYPDFVAMLIDGRKLVVEYKGGDKYDNPSEVEKRRVGELWAAASGGQCVYVMPTRRDFTAIDRAIEARS
ncbi:MAG: DEAD/DEAH box helicase family protein [Pseudomonadota bacterium]